MKIEIKNWFTDSVIYGGEFENIKECPSCKTINCERN